MFQSEAHVDIYRRNIITQAFSAPFLMRAVLGLSALQLSLEQNDPDYARTAAIFQSQALRLFDRKILENVDESNVLKLLLFQHTTALHNFCDVFTSLDNFDEFMDRLVGCMRLLQGVNPVIQTHWHILSRTELGVVMDSSDKHSNTPYESRGHCIQLLTMLADADLSSKSIEVCREAVAKLQKYLDAEDHLGPTDSTNMVFSWLITASPEYINLLELRRPEALVIFAYYTTLLHKRRNNWAIADSGGKLLKQIRIYLGTRWDRQLDWPRSQVEI